MPISGLLSKRRHRVDPRAELRKVLDAHARTIAVCEACAVTTRDLAAEVARGGVPSRADLEQTVAEAEQVLAQMAALRDELERVRAELGSV